MKFWSGQGETNDAAPNVQAIPMKKFWSGQRETNEVTQRPTWSHFPILHPFDFMEAEIVRCAGLELIPAIPWGLIEQHKTQALKNHTRTIEQLAQLCGLSACEAVAVLEDRPWRRMRPDEAYARLAELVRAYEPGSPNGRRTG